MHHITLKNLKIPVIDRMIFIKIYWASKTTQTEENEYLKAKLLKNDEDLFNELYYISKERYKEQEDAVNKKRNLTKQN